MTQVREKFTATEYLKGVFIFVGVIAAIILIGAFIGLFTDNAGNSSCSDTSAESSQYCDSTRQGP